MTENIPTRLFDFSGDNGYLLMAIARTKENPHLDSEIVFREFVSDRNTLDRKYHKLCTLADNYKADTKWRIYSSINARDSKKAQWDYLEQIQSWLRQESNNHSHDKHTRIDAHWYSQLQKKSSSSESRFIFDIDGSNEDFKTVIRAIEPHGIHTTSTPNGWHIVTEPFNYTELEIDAEYELKKDDLLFIEKRES